MKLTFTPTSNPPREKDILAAVAFDLNPSENLRNIPTGLSRDTLAAVIVAAENKHEVWFGTTIQPQQLTTSVAIQLPGLVKAYPKGYRLEFKILEGALKRISGGSSGISQARISDVAVLLPDGWELDPDPNWTEEKRSEWKFKGSLSSPIRARFRQDIWPWQEWMKNNVPQFFTVLIGAVAVASAARRVWPKISLMIFGPMVILIAGWLYWRRGSQEWVEENWWLISVSFGLMFAMVIPRRSIDVLLGAFKPSEEPKNPQAAPK